MAMTITPLTDGLLLVTLEDENGAAIASGTVTATIVNPRGTAVATDAPLTYSGAGGIWQLALDADWSEVAGRPLSGEYVARVTSTVAGKTLTDNVRYVVEFTDKT